MKPVFITLLFVLFNSCLSPALIKAQGEPNKKEPQNRCKITNLPFGCNNLKAIPLEWNRAFGVHGTTNGEDSVFENVSKCFYELSKVDTLAAPEIRSIEFIEFDDNEMAFCFPSNINDFKPSGFRYRLPDLNKFEVYYAFQEFPFGVLGSYDCYAMGSLVILDPDHLHAKVLPLYTSASVESIMLYQQFFYVSSYKDISVTQFLIEELNGSLISKYRIRINKRGDVKARKTFTHKRSITGQR